MQQRTNALGEKIRAENVVLRAVEVIQEQLTKFDKLQAAVISNYHARYGQTAAG